MRPVSSLTASAREIAETGDPSRHMPEPKIDDEVGELARTLEQMLRSLDAARAEREAAMKKQREFVADASHELRTPLTSILANLELLQASLREPGHDDDRAMIDSALRSSQRMSRLVADLLLLARADAGKTGTHRRCDLAEVAGNAAVEAAPLMGDRELVVENDHAALDRGQPRRAAPDGPQPARQRRPPHAARRDRRAAPAGRGRRRDWSRSPTTAPASRPRSARQIFDRFVRGDGPADTAAGPGSGLGLAIVSAVAASHGGTVEVAESSSRRRPLPGAPAAQPRRAKDYVRCFRPPLAVRFL